MLKNISKLEIQIAEKVYQLLCDSDSPIHHVKEALFQFQKYIGHIEDKAKEQAEGQEKTEELEQEKECTQHE